MKWVTAGRVEFDEPVRKTRLVIPQLQGTPFEKVTPDRRDLMGFVELGLFVESNRLQEIAVIVIDAPDTIRVSIRPAADDKVTPGLRVDRHVRRSPFEGPRKDLAVSPGCASSRPTRVPREKSACNRTHLSQETGNLPGVGYELFALAGLSPPSLIEEAAVETTAAVEWKITVEGTDAFGGLPHFPCCLD